MIRPRLVLRIYLIGLAQVAALAGALWLVRPGPPGPPRRGPGEGFVRIAVEHLVQSTPDAAQLGNRLRELRDQSGAEVTILDSQGRTVASSATGAPRARGVSTVELSNGRALVWMPPPPRPEREQSAGRAVLPIALVLGLVGISAVLTTVWLGRPLAKLSQAARDLGAGKLTARADLRRNDELGDVAVAFDEMAERIGHLVRAQRELLANVSHELRTPLARIRVALDLAAEGDAEQAAASLGEIASDLGELERLVGDVLTAARLELSSDVAAPPQPPIRCERIEARELLDEAATRFRATHPAHQLVIDAGGLDARLDADRMLLRRVLDNLLDNAAKHSESSTPVTLAARVDEQKLWIEVRDQGRGIAPDDLRNLFTPFFRADRSRARQTGGLGLGLLLARRIVEAHRGSLEIESAPQRGTVARVRVPLAA